MLTRSTLTSLASATADLYWSFCAVSRSALLIGSRTVILTAVVISGPVDAPTQIAWQRADTRGMMVRRRLAGDSRRLACGRRPGEWFLAETETILLSQEQSMGLPC